LRNDIKKKKQEIREHVWRLLEEKDIARFPRPVYGRIPNFHGAEKAAEKIFKLDIWRKARVIKVNPDSPQKPIRYRGLVEGKTVVMASPRLKYGFIILDPNLIPPTRYSFASTIKGAFMYGRIVKLMEIPDIDLIITGCVAVDLRGGRVGKGGGYAELEYAILREIGAIDRDTIVATTIHDLQIVDRIPLEEHDLTVDIIATPTRIYYVKPRPPKPSGILWEVLGDKRELPIFKELLRMKKNSLRF